MSTNGNQPPLNPKPLPPKLQRLAEATQRLAAAAVRRDFWVRTAQALADHKPKPEANPGEQPTNNPAKEQQPE